MDQQLKNIGQRIRDERNRRHWLISQLSDMTGLSVAHISSIERGRYNFSVTSLINISAALKVDINYLIFGEAENSINTEFPELIRDCDQYEIGILVENAKTLKNILRKNKNVYE